MTTFRKTYAAQAAEQIVTAAAFLALASVLTLPTIGGVASMAAFVVTAWSLGVTLGRWAGDRKTVERRDRAASQEAHPSRARRPVPASVEDHYSGPRKIVKSDDGEAIVAYPPGATAYLVHNHGPYDGPGLECPEYGGTSGRLRGACVIEADRRRYAEAVEHLARRDAHVRDVHQAHHEGRLETVEPEDLP